MDQNLTHRNHYIPRFYLKNWSLDGKTIQTYSILVSTQQSIKNSAVWSDFYTRIFRRMIIQHAHRYVYSDRPQKGMLELNARVVNAQLYEREKQEMAGWHIEQIQAERNL